MIMNESPGDCFMFEDARNRRVINVGGSPLNVRAATETARAALAYYEPPIQCKAALDLFRQLSQHYTNEQLRNILTHDSPEVVKRKRYQRDE